MMNSKTLKVCGVAAMVALGGCLDGSRGQAPAGAEDAAPDTTADTTQSGDVGPDSTATDDITTLDIPGPNKDVKADPDASQCVAVGVTCYEDGECCEGFCTWSGKNLAPGSCQVPQPDGSFCESDAWCVSGVCTDFVCGEPELQCVEGGGSCWGPTECCSGVCSIVNNNAYVPGQCVNPQPAGAPCQSDAWCKDTQCIEGVCGGGGQTCKPLGTECYSWDGNGCCEGFCSYVGGYAYSPGKCTPKQPDGSWCAQDDWCESGTCKDGVCVQPTCLEVGAECFDGGECCTGMCTWDGEGYIAGQCATKQPVGSACVADKWCESGACVNGACAAPPVTFDKVWDEVLVPNGCTGGYCHGGASNLYMGDKNSAYYNLADQFGGNASGFPACGSFLLVVPHVPEQSMLWLRVRPTPSGQDPCVAEKMPKGGDPLSEEHAQIIYDWIAGGAPQ